MCKLVDKIVFVAEQDAIEKVEIEVFELFAGKFNPKYVTVTFDEVALKSCVEKFIEESVYCEVNGDTYYKFFGYWALIKSDDFNTIMDDFAKPNFSQQEI